MSVVSLDSAVMSVFLCTVISFIIGIFVGRFGLVEGLK